MLKLFDKPECPFCWKVRIGLSLAGLQYAQHSVDTADKPVELLALSEAGTVPVLVSDTVLLTDSPDIMAWISEHISEESFGSGAARDLEKFSDKVIGPRIRDAIFMRRDRPVEEWDQSIIDKCQDNWLETLSELEEHCDTPGPWFLGGNPSLADCALGPRFALASYYGLAGVKQFPKVSRWFDQLMQTEIMRSASPPHVVQKSVN